ncbi:ANTAR domain-containing protein [Cellulomonas marina]|uniref:Anti-anti-sigma factor n=1 Tax=Cellulomonas marina TaxID=988821 RepID=A0A1I0XHG6_9CELL|nr:ANTAR domain-containing protein [Cellulomonas marina]GIG30716.1 hypothetical protein Cma02nite_33160 [Cellulomonas marina]SFB00452.1 anti-anti-sigma factor [Cellulomonas marina]
MSLDDLLHLGALSPGAGPDLVCTVGGAHPVVVAPSGELDRQGGPFLVGLAGLVASRPGVDVVVDLTGVGYVDVAGMRALATARDLVVERGGELRVRGASGTARVVATVMGLEELLDERAGAPAGTVASAAVPTDGPVAVVAVPGLTTGVLELAAVPVHHAELHAALGAFVDVVLRTVPGATAVSVQLGSAAEPTEVASTSRRAAELDGWQIRAGEGPCVESGDTSRTVVSADVLTDARWPRLVRAARAGGAVPVVSSPLLDEGRAIGGVNVYGADGGVFHGGHRHAVEVMAAGTTTGVEQLRLHAELRTQADQLRQALVSRATIDQAKGIVMAHRGGTPDEAFTFLSALSQHKNVKLRDPAREMVEQASHAAAPSGRPSGPRGPVAAGVRSSSGTSLPARRGAGGTGA